MVDKNTLQIESSWFNTPPAHLEMTHLNQELMLQVVPTALQMTFDQLKMLDNFKPSPSYFSTKEEFLEAIELTIDEGITPAKGYIKEVYVIEDFPISGELTIYDDKYMMGLGHVSLLGGHWSAYLTNTKFESIPETTLNSMIKEFDLKYQNNENSNHPHFLRSNPDNDGISQAWYIQDCYLNETLSFAKNLTVAYTNAFLQFYNSTISDKSLESFSGNTFK